MLKWLLIASGGALGSVARYALHGWAQRLTSASFPLGTLVVNVIGCALVGLLAGIFASNTIVREEYRLGLTVGFLGGFTTFSAFGLETFHLANTGNWRWAAANIILSCGIGLLAVWLGFRAAQRWFGA